MVVKKIFGVGALAAWALVLLAEDAGRPVYIYSGSGQDLPAGYLVVTCAVPAETAASMPTLTTAPVPVAVATAPAEVPEQKVSARDWKASFYGGFAAKSGNSSESSYRYGGEFEKKDGKLYRYKLKADGRFSQAEEKTTTSKAELSGEMRRLVSERWFVSGRMTALHDDVKGIDYRAKVGPGVGLYLADSENLRADAGTGLLYVQEKSASNDGGYIAWRLSQRLDWQMTELLKWWTETEFYLNLMEPAHYQLTFKTGIESRLNDHLSLVIGLEDDYDSLPERTGNIQKNDVEISTSLRYKL